MKLGAAVVNGENRAAKKEPAKESEVVPPVWMEKAERLWGCELREKQVQIGGSGRPQSTRPSLASQLKTKTADGGCARSYSLNSNMQKRQQNLRKNLKIFWATPKEERTVGEVQESRACAVSSKAPGALDLGIKARLCHGARG